jgi:uncharacterized protein (DUF302 family)
VIARQIPRYALLTTVPASFAEADRRVREALQEEGFGVISEVDVSATLKKKLDVDMPPYEILGACAPKLAHHALGLEPDIGLLLPCNVVVRVEEPEGTTVVEALDPVAQLSVSENTVLLPLAREVRERMQRVIERLGAASWEDRAGRGSRSLTPPAAAPAASSAPSSDTRR